MPEQSLVSPRPALNANVVNFKRITTRDESLHIIKVCSIIFFVLFGFSLISSFSASIYIFINILLLVLTFLVYKLHSKVSSVLLLVIFALWFAYLLVINVEVAMATGHEIGNLGSLLLLVIQFVLGIRLTQATYKIKDMPASQEERILEKF